MKLPYLSFWDVTPVTVIVTGEMGENGAPEVLLTYNGKCNFEGVASIRNTKDGKTINLGGKLTIKGDIAPMVANITGSAILNGHERGIFNSEKVLNPDGTVNHTRLELL